MQINDGQGEPLNLIVEIKGYQSEAEKEKNLTMDTYWIPGINNLHRCGRWAFAEFADVFDMQQDLEQKVAAEFKQMVASAGSER